MGVVILSKVLDKVSRQGDEQEKGKDEKFKVLIFGTNSNDIHIEEVDADQEEFRHDENVYSLDREKMCKIGKKYGFIFRAGHKDPKTWDRFDGKFKPADFYTVRHETTTIEGIMNMLGIEGAGNLGKKQWLIILGVVAGLILTFIFLQPKLAAIIGG